MEPAIDIFTYLWDSRKTWFNHQNIECDCPIEEQIEDFIDQLPVSVYMEIVELDEGVSAHFLHQTDAEWNETIGPAAQERALQNVLDFHIDQASKIIAIQASEEQ